MRRDAGWRTPPSPLINFVYLLDKCYATIRPEQIDCEQWLYSGYIICFIIIVFIHSHHTSPQHGPHHDSNHVTHHTHGPSRLTMLSFLLRTTVRSHAVYKVQCEGCPSFYVGKTINHIFFWLKREITSMSENLPVFQHAMSSGENCHFILENTTILCSDPIDSASKSPFWSNNSNLI